MISSNNRERDSRNRYVASITFEIEVFTSQSFEFTALFIINEFFVENAELVIRSNASSLDSSKSRIFFFTNAQQRKLMLVIRKQIKNEINEIMIFMQQQLITFIVAFVKLINVESTSINKNSINEKISSFDSFDSFASFFPSASFTSFVSFVKQLRVENVNYFDSNYQQKKNNILRTRQQYIFVVNVKKHVYYIEIYNFVDKLKDLIISHDEIVVRQIIIVCFRDQILM